MRSEPANGWPVTVAGAAGRRVHRLVRPARKTIRFLVRSPAGLPRKCSYLDRVWLSQRQRQIGADAGLALDVGVVTGHGCA